MSPEEKAPKDGAVNAGTEPTEPTPTEIREEIDQTREELGDTVEALAEKTDVKAQAKAKVEDTKAQAKAKVEDAKAKVKGLGDKAKESAPESPQEGVAQAQALVKENPKPAAVAAALIVLFVLWRLLRS